MSERTTSKMKHLSEALQLPLESLQKTFDRESALRRMKIETIISNFRSLSPGLGLSETELSKCFVRQPRLLCLRPEKLISNFDALSELLSVDRAQLRIAVVRGPQLILSGPIVILNNAIDSSRLFSVDQSLFVRAGLRHPPLLSLRPLLLRSKIPYVRRIARALHRTYDPVDMLNTMPAAYCYAKHYLFARYLLVKWGIYANHSLAGVLTSSWHEVRIRMTTYLSTLPDEHRVRLSRSLSSRSIL